MKFCRRFIDIAEINVAVAARGRSPASKVSSQSIVFLENVLWLEFCDSFLCEFRFALNYSDCRGVYCWQTMIFLLVGAVGLLGRLRPR